MLDIANVFQHALVNIEDNLYLKDKDIFYRGEILGILKIENNSSFIQEKYSEDNFAQVDCCN